MTQQDYNDLKGRTVYGRQACKGKTGTITEVRQPDHPRNHYKDGVIGLLIEYPGNIGAEGVIAEKLVNDKVRDWTLDEEDGEQ